MTTNVGRGWKPRRSALTPIWVAFAFGSVLGGFIGLRGGAAAAVARFQAQTVPLSEYRRECEECERIAVLYAAERKRNVQLSGSHTPTVHVVK